METGRTATSQADAQTIDGWLSHRLSAAIAEVLEQEGFTPTEVLTHVPPYWRSLTGIAIQLDHLTQEERAHPNLLDCNDLPG